MAAVCLFVTLELAVFIDLGLGGFRVNKSFSSASFGCIPHRRQNEISSKTKVFCHFVIDLACLYNLLSDAAQSRTRSR